LAEGFFQADWHSLSRQNELSKIQASHLAEFDNHLRLNHSLTKPPMSQSVCGPPASLQKSSRH